MIVSGLLGVSLLAAVCGLDLGHLKLGGEDQVRHDASKAIFCSFGPYQISSDQYIRSFAQAEGFCKSSGLNLASINISDAQLVGEALATCLGPEAEAWINFAPTPACSSLKLWGNGEWSLRQHKSCGSIDQLSSICVGPPVPKKMTVRQEPQSRTKSKKHRRHRANDNKNTKGHLRERQSLLNDQSVRSQDETRDPRTRRGDPSAIEKPYLAKPYRGPGWKPDDRH